MRPENDDSLLRETIALLSRKRPLYLESDLGSRLLQNMLARNGTGVPANQHFFIVNARDGFYDPQRKKQKGKGKGKWIPQAAVPYELDTNHHLGYLPLNLQGIVSNHKFKGILETLADDIYTALRQPGTFLQDDIHVLFWCNQGCHRSVSFCRLALIAADELNWQNPSCSRGASIKK